MRTNRFFRVMWPVLLAVLALSTRARADDYAYWTYTAGLQSLSVGEETPFYCPKKPASLNLSTLPVYGTDVYLMDSSVCAAAVHAGVINPDYGGTVTIVIQPTPVAKFVGSTRNGVTSKSWAGGLSGFRFSGAGTTAVRGPPKPPTLLGPADTSKTHGNPTVYIDPRNPQVLLSWQDNGNANENYTNEFEVTLWADYGRKHEYRQVVKKKHIGTRTSIPVKKSLRPNSCYWWQVAAIDPKSQANPWEVWSDEWFFCTGNY